jgi:hypothetical protein
MNVLITNIGNRNIKYQDKFYSELELKGEQVDTALNFREWTKFLLKNFDNERDNIKLNILNTILDSPSSKPDKVIIIVSNQSNSEFNAQDTLHEGEIIKKLIHSNYYIEDIEIKELTDDVTNENYLLKFYQSLFSELLHKYCTDTFYFCDAGGTGQQKAASKIMAEFMIPDTQWRILYPKKDGNIEEKTQIEYRYIINKEQAISLLRKSQYEAALDILGGNINKIDQNQTFNLVSFAHFRINRVLERTQKLYDEKDALINRKNSVIKSAIHPEMRDHSKTLLGIFSNNNRYLFLSESLLIAYRKFLINNYRDSILDFAVFYEEFIDKCISRIKKEVKKVVGENNVSSKDCIGVWINDPRNPLPQTLKYISGKVWNSDKIDYTSVPIAIHIIEEQNFIPELKPLAKILCQYIDFTYPDYQEGKENSVRVVRNKLAHEGKYLDKTTLDKEMPYYENLLHQCLDAWGLLREDIYEQLNKMIEASIRNS